MAQVNKTKEGEACLRAGEGLGGTGWSQSQGSVGRCWHVMFVKTQSLRRIESLLKCDCLPWREEGRKSGHDGSISEGEIMEGTRDHAHL